MMSLEPLNYALNTLTFWHALALSLLCAPTAWIYVNGNIDAQLVRNPIFGLLLQAGMVTWVYFLIAPVVGQVFGDKYSFAQVWPSSVTLGVTFAAMIITVSASREWSDMNAKLAGFLASAFVVFSLFLGLALNLFLWLLPRVIGFGLIDFPKLSWGVQL
ncbi:MAG: hypothetical protein ACMUJI_06410 [Erythrobacter sp.]|uniref:hypothetical protein n=1 Tax=Erythrobacter sp. TaxID=1042 RepID=UPI003A8B5C2D